MAEAFQHDFAARMDWTIRDYAHADHHPPVEVNGRRGTAPIQKDAGVGWPITLDASRSHRPDGDKLRYTWFHYPEAGEPVQATLHDYLMILQIHRKSFAKTTKDKSKMNISSNQSTRVRLICRGLLNFQKMDPRRATTMTFTIGYPRAARRTGARFED
jgi:hypothetical protein